MLKNKNFIYLWVSQILSQVTIHMMNFLLLARVYEITKSPIATSFIWVAYAIPTIFFGPIAATTTDIFDKKKILVVTNLLQALVIFSYVFVYDFSIMYLYLIVFVYSLLNQFYVPSEMSVLPTLIPKKTLPKANSLFFLTQQLSLIFGFGVAGFIAKQIGFSGSLIMSSILLLMAFISVSFLPKQGTKVKVPDNFNKLIKTFFDKIIEGYLFIKNRKAILYPLLILFSIQVCLSIGVSILPVIATQILKLDVSFIGLMIVVPAGIGAIIGAYTINKLLKRKSWRKKNLIDVGLLVGAISIMWLVLGSPVTAPITLLLMGFSFVSINIPTLSYLQEVTPSWLRGRVFGNLFFFVTIATLLPVIFSGVITQYFGVKTLLTILAIGAILLLVISLKRGKEVIQNNF